MGLRGFTGGNMTLRQKQSMFIRFVGKLIEYADENGYELTGGELWRPPETAELYEQQGKGIANSLHKSRLAIDFNVFKDNIWLRKGEEFTDLGKYWESLHPMCAWGGRFNDGNHFSLMHGGRK